MKQLILFALIYLFFFPVTYGQDISEWRGIGRTGVYNETGLLKEWTESGPELLWSIEDIPEGFSSAALANNMVYITGITGSKNFLVAIDKKGNIKWQTQYGRAWTTNRRGSRCTPSVENNRIYVSSGLGDVACIDANNGELIWSVKAHEEFEGTYGMWGLAESLLLIDNKLIYKPGGKKTSIVALDKKTGETIWMSESLKDGPAYSSPMLIERGGKKIILTVTEKFIIGVKPEDGKILWNFDFGSYAGGSHGANNNTNTPLYYDGGIFVTSGYDHKSVMLKLAEDASSVSLEWVDDVLDTHHGGVVRIGEYIYGSNWEHNAMGNWICLDWNSGKVMYEKKWINKGSIIAAEGMLYCYEEKNGNIALVKASPNDFNIISSFKVPLGSVPHWAHPVINDGILYIRHGDTLMAYDIKEK